MMEIKSIKEMESVIQAIENFMSAEVERMARQLMVSFPHLKEFVMAMGVASFVDKYGNDVKIMGINYMKELDEFLQKYDEDYHITGEPMRFTATGEKIVNW